ncbi:MAG: serine hydrolase [Bacteroidota bacterium]
MKKLFICCSLLVFVDSCAPFEAFVYNRPGAKDYKLFPAHELKKSDDPFCFHYADKQISFPDTMSTNELTGLSLQSFLNETETISLLIVRNDSILFQYNDQEFNDTKRVMSFSMAKSVTSMLIGCAIDDQLIPSVHEKVVSYVPELAYIEGIDQLTIEHLLNMRSGINFNEKHLDPFNGLARLYYGRSFLPILKKRSFRDKPNTVFKYQNSDTELLGLILQRVLKEKTIADFCNEKIWVPLGMEYRATWSTFKKEDLEKTFCGIGATAIDYAKLGRLYLNKGNWEGQQLISQNWVDASWKYQNIVKDGKAYNYQWWSINDHTFWADGVNGQYIYSDTDKNVIIVRLGHTAENFRWRPFMQKIVEGL